MGVSSSLSFTRHLDYPQTQDDQGCSFSYRALIGSCRCNSPQPGTEHWRPWPRSWSQCQYWNTQSTTKLGRMGSSYWTGTMGLAKPATQQPAQQMDPNMMIMLMMVMNNKDSSDNMFPLMMVMMMGQGGNQDLMPLMMVMMMGDKSGDNSDKLPLMMVIMMMGNQGGNQDMTLPMMMMMMMNQNDEKADEGEE